MFLQNLENLNGQGDRLAQEDEKLAGVPFEVIPKAAQDKAYEEESVCSTGIKE